MTIKIERNLIQIDDVYLDTSEMDTETFDSITRLISAARIEGFGEGAMFAHAHMQRTMDDIKERYGT